MRIGLKFWPVTATAIFIGALLASPKPAYADFLYSNFTSTQGLVLVDAAQSVDGRLRLNPDATYTGGAAWRENQEDVASGFSTSFDFQITHGATYADGIWFVIQSDALSSASLWNGLPGSFTVELDDFQNVWDPNDNHAAFQSCGPAMPNTTRHDTGCTLAINSNLPITLADGQVHNVRMTYTPGDMTLSLDGAQVLQSQVDLRSAMTLNSSKAWVGFMTSTGAYSETNDILDWRFNSVPEPNTTLLVCLPGGFLMILGICRSRRNLTNSPKSGFNPLASLKGTLPRSNSGRSVRLHKQSMWKSKQSSLFRRRTIPLVPQGLACNGCEH
ncbi:MAG TPA: L-type lectin-domain containing protein [Bryobacteraceae bacterium]|jgi:hypothetical protein|nr:L-type lectin-domain containing protein [Bryobacteraceae bacterium]